jgi:hypothetical protein
LINYFIKIKKLTRPILGLYITYNIKLMINIKKRLTIEIEEPKESEEDIQNSLINQELTTYKMLESPMFFENPSAFFEEEKNKILGMNNPTINQLSQFMEGENNILDLSHHL